MKALRTYMDLTGKTQAELARQCDLEPGLFSRYINGQADPSVRVLKRMAARTGIALERLLEDVGNDPDGRAAAPSQEGEAAPAEA